jgi:LacI family transcriptional regulator
MDDVGNGPKVTIFEIAATAGVSIATADRALNGRKGVAAATAEKVRAAAEAHNWRPNPVAQSLSRREALVFDVLLPSGGNIFIRRMEELVAAARSEFAPFRIAPRAVTIDALSPKALATALDGLHGRSQGVAFIALDHPEVRAATDRLVEAGIPTVTLVSDLSGSRRHGYVGVDNLAAGRTAGLFAGRFLAGRAGAVALIAGSAYYRGHIEREEGFRQVLGERFPWLRALPLLENQEEDTHSYRQTRALLAKEPALVGIYLTGGGMAGVIQALDEVGRTDQMVVVGHELVGGMRGFLARGAVDLVISQDPNRQIHRAIRMLADIRSRLIPPGQMELTRIEIISAENLP